MSQGSLTLHADGRVSMWDCMCQRRLVGVNCVSVDTVLAETEENRVLLEAHFKKFGWIEPSAWSPHWELTLHQMQLNDEKFFGVLVSCIDQVSVDLGED